MTKKEAYAILSLDLDDDLEDVYDSQLFAFKSFFTSKPIVWSVFNSKLEKLKRVEEALNFLGIKSSGFESPETFKLKSSEIIIDLFNDFQLLKNQIYLLIHHSESLMELAFNVNQLLNVSFEYNSHWPETKIDAQSVLLSKEIDLMELHNAICKLNESGIRTFQNLLDDKNTEINYVKKESLRLYLLHQKEMEWKRSSQS